MVPTNSTISINLVVNNQMLTLQSDIDRSLNRGLTHLDALEAESVFIMREVAAEFERPVLLFSGGKDSIVMLRLAEKAFRPAKFPFPVMHIDTGHNFPEVLDYRDRTRRASWASA